MPYSIEIADRAVTHFRSLSARERKIVEEGVAARLTMQPTTPTKAIKRLRANAFAEFELRLGDLRILYNVDEENPIVRILVIGRKAGNRLIVEGQEFHEHDSDRSE